MTDGVCHYRLQVYMFTSSPNKMSSGTVNLRNYANTFLNSSHFNPVCRNFQPYLLADFSNLF